MQGKALNYEHGGTRFKSSLVHVMHILAFSSISLYLFNQYSIRFSRTVQITLRHSPPLNPHILQYVPKLLVLVIFSSSSVSLAMSTLSLHFEHVHSFHPNHCHHPIHHILRSLSSYNLTLEFIIFMLEPSFVEISSLVTPFKSAWPLSSVVVAVPSLFTLFITLNVLEIGCRWLDHFDIWLSLLSFCPDRSCPIDS